MKRKAVKASKNKQSGKVPKKKVKVSIPHTVGTTPLQESADISNPLASREAEPTTIDAVGKTEENHCLPERIISAEDDPSLTESSALDPYLLQDAEYLKNPSALRWKNKQRTLLFCSRGVKHRERHLLEDLKRLLPHHKSESKWEKKEALHEINELCELSLCNNVIFLESRKNDLFMWMGRSPHGPSAKFRIYNLHTLGELKLTGNCLLYSRPLLVFDNSFSQLPLLKVLRELFIQVFGTPRNHPKSKPFHDHALCWYYHDNKIWFRHYQISPFMVSDPNKIVEKAEQQTLTEIGPRFVMDPIKILEGSFQGKIIWKNPHYTSQNALRTRFRMEQSNNYMKRRKATEKHKVHTIKNVPAEAEVSNETVFGDDSKTS
ncbi:brix domain-containing protein [Cardiosporidium cionae]|uniref:Brix domain-containing protein n=1 Tax=Cardiosporidium cionae TaxID=476202 RepID=A0ABQ7J9N4_9APIC|nr:brix domain-containing protein [Cardiosporidium cionae]|eukprot:KAF8820712.1 brix domain-containing protein [Cardiosporidium cionae]